MADCFLFHCYFFVHTVVKQTNKQKKPHHIKFTLLTSQGRWREASGLHRGHATSGLLAALWAPLQQCSPAMATALPSGGTSQTQLGPLPKLAELASLCPSPGHQPAATSTVDTGVSALSFYVLIIPTSCSASSSPGWSLPSSAATSVMSGSSLFTLANAFAPS